MDRCRLPTTCPESDSRQAEISWTPIFRHYCSLTVIGAEVELP
jgi:hypothetical protein